MVCRDDWPLGPDGEPYDGTQLMDLVRNKCSPFRASWDVELLIREIEAELDTQVIDIPIVEKGSNNYTSNKQDLVARLARGDVNMPDFDGFSIEKQVPEARFEAAIYKLVRSVSEIRASYLLYHRLPKQISGPRLAIPRNLDGRRLFVFEKGERENNVWDEISADAKLLLLDQLAHIRAALFRYNLPPQFAAQYLHDRIFDLKPESFNVPVAPSREFWIHVLKSKIEATIRNEGDMIGWEDDQETVGPIHLAAKQSLLRVIPHIMSEESADLYRLVLEHGDFGIHNASITTNVNGGPLVTSLYDWETACIVPALLSDPLVAVYPIDLIAGEAGEPCVTRIPQTLTATNLETYAM
ncbi:MAG: hypothetical protein Q9213_006042 [Squamulea squamosa]